MSVYSKEHPEYLSEAFQSLADQTRKADEIVLVEDGAISAELDAVINEYREVLNIRSVRLATNQGLAAALNTGLMYCSYDIVARMDTDDVALPNRFETQILFMKQHPEISVSSAQIEEFVDCYKTLSVRRLPLEHKEICKFAKRRNPLSHPVAVFRKRAVQAVGGYPPVFPEDYGLWSLMLQHGYKMANLPDILLRMRTNRDFIRRRGFSFLRGEINLLRFQKRIGFLSWRDFIVNLAIRSAFRLPPEQIRYVLYRLVRRNRMKNSMTVCKVSRNYYNEN